MSLADNFMSAAKQILLATENIKRLDEKVHRLADDVSGIDRRLIRIETFVEIGKSVPAAAPCPPTTPSLTPAASRWCEAIPLRNSAFAIVSRQDTSTLGLFACCR